MFRSTVHFTERDFSNLLVSGEKFHFFRPTSSSHAMQKRAGASWARAPRHEETLSPFLRVTEVFVPFIIKVLKPMQFPKTRSIAASILVLWSSSDETTWCF
ncbi:hypothetical protein TNCT_144261 [Trichonephila clavata]|uniref:Uncharacterized protein n=1 Tax=Trichonephila clavata TaxID=2740835 RepID=A0A8X6HR10_TRICU|nr:hypothetical protein TNCT_144261 [Trichonephila clavata]